MSLDGLHFKQEGKNTPLNSCKVILKNSKQTITTKGVALTKDAELYMSLLDYPR